MCVGCRRVRPQTELVRFRRGSDQRLTVETGARGPGRGAYLCRDPACLQVARKRRAIERALRGPVSPDDWTVLEAGILVQAPGERRV